MNLRKALLIHTYMMMTWPSRRSFEPESRGGAIILYFNSIQFNSIFSARAVYYNFIIQSIAIKQQRIRTDRNACPANEIKTNSSRRCSRSRSQLLLSSQESEGKLVYVWYGMVWYDTGYKC